MRLDLDRQEHGRSELPIDGTLDLGLEDGRPGGARVCGVLVVDNLDSRYLLNGTLSAAGRAQCGRCLRDFDLEWEVPVELTVLRDVESDEGEGESLVIMQKTGEVELAEPLRESVVLAFPQAAVCNENCKGLCPTCGIDRNTEPCACADEDHDPRWEGLP